jgi:predicted PurR-regulated permease PerM
VLGIDAKAARATWTVFLVLLLISTTYAVRETLIVFVGALFFAHLLAPLVGGVERRLPKNLSRQFALAIVYTALVGILVGIGIAIGSRIADEASSLAARLPSIIQNPDWLNRIPLPGALEPMRAKIIVTIQEEFRGGAKDLMPYLSAAGVRVVSSLSTLVYLILIPILAFFFLKDATLLRNNLLDLMPSPSERSLAEEIIGDIHVLLGQYIRSLVVLSVATFVVYSMFLSFTGAPYALLLAGIGAVFELIPVIGPATAGAVVMLVTGFSGYTHLAAFAIFWVCSRGFQDYVLSPYLMSAGIELHPLVVLFGVLAGERVGGIPGMFFSVPVLATLRVIYVRARRARRQQLAPESVRG